MSAQPPPPPGAPPPGGGAPGDRPPPTPPPGGPPPGAPPPGPPGGQPPDWQPATSGPAADANGVALGSLITGIAALVFGIVGVLVLPLLLSIPAGLVAIVLGVVGRRKAAQGAGRAGQALGGVVTGSLALLLSGLWIAVLVFFGGQFVTEFGDDIEDFERCLEETGDEERCQERFEQQLEQELEERLTPGQQGS